jgi:hypothetical protein
MSNILGVASFARSSIIHQATEFLTFHLECRPHVYERL